MPWNDEDCEALARDTILDPESEEDGGQLETDKARNKGHVQRLQRLPSPFTRIPVQWYVKPHKPCPFDAKTRIFLALLEDSRWGQKEVLSQCVLELALARSPVL